MWLPRFFSSWTVHAQWTWKWEVWSFLGQSTPIGCLVPNGQLWKHMCKQHCMRSTGYICKYICIYKYIYVNDHNWWKERPWIFMRTSRVIWRSLEEENAIKYNLKNKENRWKKSLMHMWKCILYKACVFYTLFWLNYTTKYFHF